MNIALAAFLFSTIVLCGCAIPQSKNPSFPLTNRHAHSELKAMRKNPIPLSRPLVILGGFYDFGVPAVVLKRWALQTFDGERILAISFMGCQTFESCAERLICAVESRFPSSSCERTIEVDVIAVSMGGLVARYAALPQENSKRLRIQRLFTISTPHRGARLARLPAWEPVQVDMRPGSSFLRRLRKEKENYEIFPYVRLKDKLIGPQNAAPWGEDPWWVPHHVLTSHLFSFLDKRIIADIFARLRGDAAFATLPRTPVPEPKETSGKK